MSNYPKWRIFLSCEVRNVNRSILRWTIFRSKTFFELIPWSKCPFSEVPHFQNETFFKWPIFQDDLFYKLTHFRSDLYCEDINFEVENFPKWHIFRSNIFSELNNFSNWCIFSDAIDLEVSLFSAVTYFSKWLIFQKDPFLRSEKFF